MEQLIAIATSAASRRLIARFFCLALIVALASLWPVRARQLDGDPAHALEFFDRYGRRLGMLYDRDERHAVSVPLARIAPSFTAAILSAEDHRFFEHGPIDAAALARRPLGGASTISIQLARLIEPVPPTFIGKIRETILAARLESGLSKTRILQAYCNRIPMGSNLYGIEAAARTYFGVPASDLNLAQASLLAALPNDPVRLDPYRHWNALKARQAYVLARMRADGKITAEQASQALQERIELQERPIGIASAAHFLFWLAPRVPAERTRVTTTIDLSLQTFVQAQVRAVVEALARSGVHDASAIVIDNRTRQILAYVGSPDYFDDEILGRNDGVQALRQPGSALKPFLYELALERRILRPSSILQDRPTSYALPGARVYRPLDYSKEFLGPVRVRIALADSLNVPAVRVLERVGVESFLQRLHELGFSHLDKPADYYGLGLTLGGGEVTLFELARAYASAAGGGVALPLTATLDAPLRGSDIPTARDQAAAADSASWALVTDMLADAHARAAAFGVDSVLALPFPAAVKTGTSSDYRDTWTLGFTREYTVGAWVGNFDGTPMRRVSGVSGAGPLWNRIMLHLHERREPPRFDPPHGYEHRPICAETGTKPDASCRAVVMEYLDADDLRAWRRSYPPHLPTSDEKQGVEILFPHDGDRFVAYPGSDPSQRLQFAFSQTRSLRVFLNDGRLLPIGNDYLWQLKPGSYTLRACSSTGEASVRFTVTKPSPRRRGFTLLQASKM